MLAIVALFLAATPASARTSPDVVPALEPTSHKHFFEEDYPHDISPTGKLEKDFTHPYPEVLDHESFDKDYVKDENNDNGEWKVQTEYDHLRSKLVQQKKEREQAKVRAAKLKAQIAKVKAEEEKAREKLTAKEKAKAALEAKRGEEAVAKRAADKAKEDLDKAESAKAAADAAADKAKADGKSDDAALEAAADGASGGDDVKKAEAQVGKELKDVEHCKEEMEKAQEKLQRLQDERIKAEQEEQLASAAEEAKLKEEAAAKSRAAELEEQLQKEAAENEAAQATATAEQEKFEKMENDYDVAEKNLHKLRHKQVDNGGGVYRTKEKSGAIMHAPFVAVSIALLASL